MNVVILRNSIIFKSFIKIIIKTIHFLLLCIIYYILNSIYIQFFFFYFNLAGTGNLAGT